ncbi:membrane protein [Azorhizobium oxalatiphilum]|uniref:Membrane protein n=1 Tax=Azorhizobium oxalatiphilum TaxID=980631 RepID=A0A917BUI5_9HYPH|nr:NAD(P)H-binding protein [Azorhizobium oxalatiphilum]GGF54919.1 membrane protein [Azorhizobium oxalatiphilum]
MDRQDTRTALVLGATGGIGGETAAALLRRGWRVKALVRDPVSASRRWPFAGSAPEWIAGDAMMRDQVIAAAEGAQLIVHGVNPPGYRDWDRLVVPMMENTIAAARVAGARVVLPGTVYNFGPDAFADPHEDAPQNPLTRKGALRVEMERRLETAAGEGVPVLIVRFGDFFGPRSGNTWFAQGLVKPGKPVTSIANPAAPGIGHQWAYLPDAAETIARLVEQADHLPAFARFHMEGHWDADGTEMVGAIRRVTGGTARVKHFPWWVLPLAAPFVTVFRELREMRYLWQVPLHMRNARLVAILGAEPHTPLDEAVRATLRGLRCLPRSP